MENIEDTLRTLLEKIEILTQDTKELKEQISTIHRITQPVARVSDKKKDRIANIKMTILNKRNKKCIERV